MNRHLLNTAWHRMLTAIALLLLTSPLLAQPNKTETTALSVSIDRLLDAQAMQAGFQGILIQPDSGEAVLYARNADRVFLPASNNKLLTASAALATLGPNFAYATRVYTTGSMRSDGTLEGDLILRGSGDPTLEVADLADLAQQLAKAGIHAVTGAVRYDDSLFDRQWLGDGWTWDDEPFYYSAQTSALNVNENVVRFTVQPGEKEGDPVKVDYLPASSVITLVSSATTGPRGTQPDIGIERERGSNVFHVTGRIAAGTAENTWARPTLTIYNPAAFTAGVFESELVRAGIHLGDTHLGASAPIAKEARSLAEHTSKPLSQLLAIMLKPSDNLMAECLLKTVGAVRKGIGTSGYSGTGATTAREWLLSIGLDRNGLHQSDGSGLSRMNYVSPRNLVRLLRFWTSRPEFDTFYAALPIAGIDGTLRNRLKSTLAANNCHAKTGSLSHVSSLSGYVTTRDGVRLVFSILMNNQLGPASESTALQNRIVTLLAELNYKEWAASRQTTTTALPANQLQTKQASTGACP